MFKPIIKAAKFAKAEITKAYNRAKPHVAKVWQNVKQEIAHPGLKTVAVCVVSVCGLAMPVASWQAKKPVNIIGWVDIGLLALTTGLIVREFVADMIAERRNRKTKMKPPEYKL